MAYSARDAANTLLAYLQLDPSRVQFLPGTASRGFVYDASEDKCVIFIYPISHKADDTKNFFDTRDSGARERCCAWNYALENGMKYFCLGVNDQVERYRDYIFSLESDEAHIEAVSGTVNGIRGGAGTQVVIPNAYVPSKRFDRILTRNNFFISVIHRSSLSDYIEKYDNRPYMASGVSSPEAASEAERNPDETAQNEVSYRTGLSSPQRRNRIIFGAPGTGKSFTLNREKDILLSGGGDYERVTFHPDYSYSNFVGTYKPVPCRDGDGNEVITYSYVPGPFMRTLVKALKNGRTGEPKPYLLMIEELNRANTAAVFGDVFQLLDRGDDEVSAYPIQASEDIKAFLARPENLGGKPDDYSEISIPDNMFIWATMNSADQGVFPMDTAFKRRWDFTYIGIDDGEKGIAGKKVFLGQGVNRRKVEWNELRKAINGELLSYKVNEDKLMGPYFISKRDLPDGELMDTADFHAFLRIRF